MEDKKVRYGGIAKCGGGGGGEMREDVIFKGRDGRNNAEKRNLKVTCVVYNIRQDNSKLCEQ